MRRRVNCPVTVTADRHGTPVALVLDSRRVLPVRELVEHWREWIGVLEGEPERDIWLLATPRGICELHYLRQPGQGACPGSSEASTEWSDEREEAELGEWFLYRWVD